MTHNDLKLGSGNERKGTIYVDFDLGHVRLEGMWEKRPGTCLYRF